MLTIYQCREILKEKASCLTDGEVLALRDSLYGIINLIFDHLEKRQSKFH